MNRFSVHPAILRMINYARTTDLLRLNGRGNSFSFIYKFKRFPERDGSHSKSL